MTYRQQREVPQQPEERHQGRGNPDSADDSPSAAARPPRGTGTRAPGPIAESAVLNAATGGAKDAALHSSPFAHNAVPLHQPLPQPQQQQQQQGRDLGQVDTSDGLIPGSSSMGFQLSNTETSFGALTELPSSEYGSRCSRS
jgi:hypothetical protein